jgi:hypothetical protein
MELEGRAGSRQGRVTASLAGCLRCTWRFFFSFQPDKFKRKEGSFGEDFEPYVSNWD